MIKEELIYAYRNTEYYVFDPALCIKIGTVNRLLEQLLIQYDQACWAYITASNPFSGIIPDKENNRRYLLLKKAVKAYHIFEGEGIGEDPLWKPEKSLLVIGISKTDAYIIGRSFNQNAIVTGKAGEPAVLDLLR